MPYLPQAVLHPRVGLDCCVGLHSRPRCVAVVSFRQGVEDEVTNVLRRGVAQPFHFNAPSHITKRLPGMRWAQ